MSQEMRTNSGRGKMIGNAFPISLVFSPSRPLLTDKHTISYSHLSVVPMATCSLFLKEPLKSVCVCDCQAGGNVNDLYLWQHQQCLINVGKRSVMTACVGALGGAEMSFCWRDIIGKKHNSEQVGLGHLTPMYHYSRTFQVGAHRINLMGSLLLPVQHVLLGCDQLGQI